MDKKNNIDETLKKGFEFMEKGEHEKAQNIFLKGLGEWPDSIWLVHGLAESHTITGNVKRAKAYHQKLVEMTENESNPDIVMLRADSQIYLNCLSDAAESLEKILSRHPMHIPALLKKASLLSKRDERKKSNRILEKILEIDGKNPEALLLKSRNHLKDEDYTEAVRGCDIILENDPANETASRLKGEILKEKGNRRELAEHISRTLKVRPDCAYTTMLKAMLFASLKKTEKAMECFNRAILLDPYLDEAYFNKAGLLMLLKNYDEAITCYEKAFEINPESGGITDRKGLFELINQMREAEDE